MNIKEVKIKDLIPYKHNARNNKNAVDKVAMSIKEFGFKVPLVIDKNNVIVCGHTRYLASKKLKLTSVPCIVAEDLTENQIKAYRLADNKVAEFTTWDLDMLAKELDEIDISIDMSEFGFDLEIEINEPKGKDLSDKVKEVFEVIVECSGEEEQEEIFKRLIEEGYQCRVLTL